MSMFSCRLAFIAVVAIACQTAILHGAHAVGIEPLHSFSFDRVTSEAPAAKDDRASDAVLEYNAQQPLEVVAGRKPGSRAVRLDRGFYEMAAPAIDPNQGATVELWFRRWGPGSISGAGSENGMLFAVGDGYWSGLRCYLRRRDRRPLFQIGRPQPGSAISATGSEPVLDGVWNHLAVTWDGRVMRIYLNGIPVGEQEFDGPYTPPSYDRFKVGFAGAGIGSNRMDVDFVAIYRGAMTADTILSHAMDDAPLRAAQADRFQAAFQASKDDPAAVQAALAPILDDDRLETPYRVLAGILLGDAAAKLRDPDTALAMYVAAYQAAGDERLRRTAAERLLTSDTAAAGGPALQIYENLYEQSDGASWKKVALILAESYVRADRFDEAIRIYQEVLTDGELSELERVDVQSQRIEALVCREKATGHTDAAALRAARDALRESDDFRAYQTVLHEGFDTTIDRDDLLDPETALPRTDAILYMAPGGDDTNNGGIDSPLATLAGARDAVRRLRQNGRLPAGGVTVAIRGGVYPVRETLQLTAEDTGTADSPILYRALPGETPVFRGGVLVTGFAPVSDASVLARLPREARGHVLAVDLGAGGVDDFGSLSVRGMGHASYPVRPWTDLFADGRAMTLARWPNQGDDELHVGQVYRGHLATPEAGKSGEFEFDEPRMQRWSTADDPWLEGKWGHLWSGQKIPVERFDADAGRIHTGAGSGYGFKQGDPFHVLNLLEELDSPGEWYLDRTSGVLYFWPPEDVSAGGEITVQFPLLEKPFIEMRSIEHVRFEGLTFELSRVDGLVMHDCRDCAILGSTIRRIGGNALVILGGEHCGAAGCDMHVLGAGGVRLRGGDRATLARGRHYVDSCDIYDFARVDRAYAPAVHVDGVGHTIVNCRMSDSPHHAMRVEGDLHTIAFCEVFDVVYEYDDQAGIDVWGDPTYRGNRFFYNYWHDIASGHDVAGQAGIRLDDMISGTFIYGNVFRRSAGGRFGAVQIHGGKDNIVANNLFIDCQAAVSYSAWGEKRYFESLERADFRRKIQAGTTPLRMKRFPSMGIIDQAPDRNFIVGNVAVNCPWFAIRDRGVSLEIGNNIFRGDPVALGFESEDDLTLRSDSTILRHTLFRPIPFEKIGIQAGIFSPK